MRNIIIPLISCLLVACSGQETQDHTNNNEYNGKLTAVDAVVVHELSDPDKLNPLTSQGAGSTYIKKQIFMYLLDIDFESLKLTPSLAKSIPVVTQIEEGPFAGGLKIDYEIKDEATWDDGSPVTAHDVAFSYKAIKNPKVDAEHFRPYLDFLKEMEIDPENPKKVSFYTKEPYFAAEASSGAQVFIAPEHIYDPEQAIRKFSFAELSNAANKESLSANKDIIAHAIFYMMKIFKERQDLL